jgi:hypothetical protein
VVRGGEHHESDHSEDHDEDAEQNASDEEIGHPLLLGAGMGDAEGCYEGLGEPGEEFQRDVCLGSGYGILRLGLFGRRR